MNLSINITVGFVYFRPLSGTDIKRIRSGKTGQRPKNPDIQVVLIHF
jgi:hypothetical protein